VVRDPERTKSRILAAAEKEFAAKGFAGARVDAIARRARINKRMLYHYFGNKQELFRAILRHKLLDPEHSPYQYRGPEPVDLADLMVYFCRVAIQNTDFIRLLEYEGLAAGNGRVIAEEERRADEARSIDQLRQRQAEGTLPGDLDPAQLLLSFMALNSFPVAFPQLTRLVTGLAPSDPEFQRQRSEFLRRLAAYLRPRPLCPEPGTNA
jgi:TetR/AcrR family transcriptional regulator